MFWISGSYLTLLSYITNIGGNGSAYSIFKATSTSLLHDLHLDIPSVGLLIAFATLKSFNFYFINCSSGEILIADSLDWYGSPNGCLH